MFRRCILAAVFATSPSAVLGQGFLDDQHHSADLQAAMQEVLGCDVGNRRLGRIHEMGLHQLQKIEEMLKPMWQTMPTNEHDRLDWRSLRYVAHRHFMQQSSLLIRGLEPSLPVNESFHGVAQILSQQVPDHMDALLGGAHSKKGYSIADGAAFIAALEILIFDSETELLNDIFRIVNVPTNSHVGASQVKRILEHYIVHWVLRATDDVDSIVALMADRKLLEESFPDLPVVNDFVHGRMRALDFEQSRNPKHGHAKVVMDRRYSFEDVHEIVGGITGSFSKFWQSECMVMKQQLLDMDKEGTGRVKLSTFYGTGLEQDWRFGESEEYLRDMGVLDESSKSQGKQVVIANYIQAASNCIVSTSNYLVCCKNECEILMSEIEHEIKAPMASVDDVLRIVGNLSSSSSVDDEPPMLSGGLTDQLAIIANLYSGKVPLHGRLFAQWLHFAFPLDCPFPHTAGKFEHHTLTPGAYGNNYLATGMSVMLARVETAITGNNTAEDEWMSQWSEEEELFADYTHILSPWGGSKKLTKAGVVAAIVLLSIIAVVIFTSSAEETPLPKGNVAKASLRGHLV